MARCELNGFDGLIEGLNNLTANTGEIAKEAIDAASPTLKESLSQCIEEAANRGYATGELAQSIEATKAKQNAYGCFAAVRPVGANTRGVRNAEKLAYLEYGTSKQAAHPVRTKAINRASVNCEKIMRDKFEKAFQKLLSLNSR